MWNGPIGKRDARISNRRRVERSQTKTDAIERTIKARHRADEMSRRLATIPGVGVITAIALAATVVDASAFKSGRHFAAWIGLTPRQNGTGGKTHLGRISKKGEPYLRRLLVLGATAVVRYARSKPDFAGWVNALLARRPPRAVTVAAANKLARIVWAIMRRLDFPGKASRHRVDQPGVAAGPAK